MRKSKHFRKDVIIARIIAALILVVLIALIVTVVSHFKKPSTNPSSQNTQSTQDMNTGNQDSESEDTQNTELESQTTEDSSQDNPDDPQNNPDDPQNNSENNTDVVEKVYVKTTARIRLREEPNTNCRTLEGIGNGVTLEVLETLDGWYKVSYNGKIGYISADYSEIVEEQE